MDHYARKRTAAKVWQEIVLYLLKIYSAIMVSLTSYIRNHIASITWLKAETYGSINKADEIINSFFKGPQNETDGIFNASCIYLLNGHIQEARRYFLTVKTNPSSSADLQDKANNAIVAIDDICNYYTYYTKDFKGKFVPSNDEELNAALDILQCIWEQRMIENGRKHYTIDGIINSGKKEWSSLDNKVVFLLKDQNQGGTGERWDDDVKKWNLKGKGKFFPNIKKIVWGLSHPQKDYENDIYKNPETKKLMKAQIDAFAAIQPFALLECKKEPGYNSVEDSVIKENLQNFGNLLKEEIRLLNPHYLLCSSQTIYEFALDMYNGIGKEEGGGFYDETTDTLIIHCSHPSARNTNGSEPYHMVMKHLPKIKRALIDSE